MTTAVKVELALAGAMFAAAPWIIDAAPYEATMGLVYKIYFFHMPSAWMFLLAAIVAGVASARYPLRQAPGLGRDGGGGGGTGRALRAAGAGHRTALGAQGVGRVVGVGRPADLEPDDVPHLRRLPDPAAVRRAGVGEARPPAWPCSAWPTSRSSTSRSTSGARCTRKTSVVPTLPVEMGRPLWFCVTAFLLLFLALLSLRAQLERQRWRIDGLYLRPGRSVMRHLRVPLSACCCWRRVAGRRPAPAVARRVRPDLGGAAGGADPGDHPGRLGLRPGLGGGVRLRVVAGPAPAGGRARDRAARGQGLAERWRSARRPPGTSSTSRSSCCSGS